MLPQLSHINIFLVVISFMGDIWRVFTFISVWRLQCGGRSGFCSLWRHTTPDDLTSKTVINVCIALIFFILFRIFLFFFINGHINYTMLIHYINHVYTILNICICDSRGKNEIKLNFTILLFLKIMFLLLSNPLLLLRTNVLKHSVYYISLWFHMGQRCFSQM